MHFSADIDIVREIAYRTKRTPCTAQGPLEVFDQDGRDVSSGYSPQRHRIISAFPAKPFHLPSGRQIRRHVFCCVAEST